MSDVEMGGVNGEDLIPRTFTAEEEEELLAGDELEKTVEESKKQMLLAGAANGEKPAKTLHRRPDA
ncbi:hypothetical protein PRIPAC_79378 [Pristionchus pacificus]|uniref:Uncharacterized protein n=1 Tax=Pristionchus pacificus TaxID=54126 RepID=A0A2A6CL45_PRIPA|nr:hypothetical protein PRIPAC_79378 [Pristionchus pacificus]|eukprot:PDM78934.1 hypothetical protein PRIPAC_31513 [Pristionchus pacificus]